MLVRCGNMEAQVLAEVWNDLTRLGFNALAFFGVLTVSFLVVYAILKFRRY